MKIASNNTNIQTNSTSLESHDFSIGDVSTIIDILRNRLYSNPIQTLTQEYLSNARDSHRESNQARPITVTLPTRLDSVLKIRDYGVGLDKQRVRDVFVNYGISTKRNDNTQTGGFGLGAKSAWAYTDSFCVVSFFDGRRCTYVAHTGKNRNGTFELIDECDTDEPNGVEVQIPVKEFDISRFINAVYRTTFFWDTKPELKGITNLEVPKVYSEGKVAFSQNKTTLVHECDFVRSVFNIGYSNNKIYALIDGIPYDLAKVCSSINSARKLSSIVKQDHITFISVNNGDITVAASREEISSDESNIKAIEGFCANAVNDIVEIVLGEFNRNFDSLKSYVDIYERMGEVINYGHLPLNDNQKNMVFKYTEDGVVFTFDLTNNYTCDKISKIVRWSLKKKRVKHHLEGDTNASHINTGSKSIVVINNQMFSNTVRSNKLRNLLGQGYDRVYEIECNEGYLHKLQKICQARLLSELTYSTNRNSFNPRTGRIKEQDEVQIRRLDSSYGEVSSQGIQTCKISEIADRDEEFVLVPFARNDDKYSSTNADFARLVTYINSHDKQVIKCGKRDYDLLVELDNVHEYEEVVENLTDHFPLSDEKIRASIFSGVNHSLFAFKRHKNKINCPQFMSLLESYPDRIDNTRLNVSEEILDKYYTNYGRIKKEFAQTQKLETKILAAYPLLRNYVHTDMVAEYVYYINAKFQSKE